MIKLTQTFKYTKVHKAVCLLSMLNTKTIYSRSFCCINLKKQMTHDLITTSVTKSKDGWIISMKMKVDPWLDEP